MAVDALQAELSTVGSAVRLGSFCRCVSLSILRLSGKIEFGRVGQPSLRGATHRMMVGCADFVG